MMTRTADLIDAIRKGDEAGARSMVAASPDLARARDAQETSAPLLALFHRRNDLAGFLLAKKEALEPLDVFEAASFGRADRLAALLDREPSLANAYAANGFYPLGLAAFFAHEEAVKLLLGRGADPDLAARNPMKVRAIHAAAAAHSAPIAKLLVAAGADVNAPQQEGHRPLHEAASSGQVDLAAILLDAGADPDVATDDGRTPLAFAMKSGQQAMIELLRKRGASSSGR